MTICNHNISLRAEVKLLCTYMISLYLISLEVCQDMQRNKYQLPYTGDVLLLSFHGLAALDGELKVDIHVSNFDIKVRHKHMIHKLESLLPHVTTNVFGSPVCVVLKREP